MLKHQLRTLPVRIYQSDNQQRCGADAREDRDREPAGDRERPGKSRFFHAEQNERDELKNQTCAVEQNVEHQETIEAQA